ncbi:LytR/AlgR family response regulator transcription factor [Aquimarina hainanensis]|uniref:LytR/AlgR family response regulator transcription factor n=1 Tax=Aquimarina hainanensis TaxID=1578017 RepID=A0ABW5NC09_9FLAO
MYKCLIIDDEKLARQLIENHLSKIEGFEVVASCKSAIEASRILTSTPIHLLFLDVEMPVLIGTDFYKNLLQKPSVIFTTAYREYAVEGFELNAVDYLVKPITFPRFLKAIDKFLILENGKKEIVNEPRQPLDKNYLFVTENRKQVKIIFDDILYIESVKNYIKITTEHKTHLIKYSISSFEELLDSYFLRVHRSYIVNTHKITAFTKYDIEIGAIEIPIGERYRELVKIKFASKNS